MNNTIKTLSIAIFYTLILSACNGGGSSSDGPAILESSNTGVIANAGPDQFKNRGSSPLRIDLDGSQSKNTDRFEWSFLAKPSSSSTGIYYPTNTSPYFYADASGIYRLQLKVFDRQGNSSTDTVIIEVNALPVGNIQTDEHTVLNDLLVLSAHESVDEDGDNLSYSWTLVSKPIDSVSTLTSANSTSTSINPDKVGEYQFKLILNDGKAESQPVTATVTVHRPVSALNYRVIDAEYNIHNDTIIMVSEAPNTLHIYNTNDATASSVSIPLSPTSVSVGPDGEYAAVGHDGWMSYIDLKNEVIVKTISVSADIIDIVLAGNGYAYAFPRRDQHESVRSIDLTTELESTTKGIYAGTLAKLHPSNNAIYAADNGISPSDIEKFSIQNGVAEYRYDSPYHGDYAMCGDLWISKDGIRIFTRCGNVFRSSPNKDHDMTYNGSLSHSNYIKFLDHSQGKNEVAVIHGKSHFSPEDADRKLQLYDYDFLNFKEEVLLPSFVVDGKAYSGHGRFVFYHSSGDKIFVLQQAHESSGFLNDYGLVSY